MHGSLNCRRQFSLKGAKGHRVDLFVLLSGELRFSCEFGAHCCEFLPELSRLMGDSLKQLANQRQRAPSAVRSAPTRSRLSFRVTASFVKLERWEITAAAGFGNAPWSDGNFRPEIQSAWAKPIESGRQRPSGNARLVLSVVEWVDIVGAANIVSSRCLRMDKSP